MADLVISFTIPDAKVATAKQQFLTVHPNRSGGSMTDNQWIKHVIKMYINDTVRQGKLELEQQQFVHDEDDYMPTD